MTRDLYHAVFWPAVIAGFFMGIYLKTGISIEPTDIAMNISGAIASQAGGASAWNSFSILFFVVSLITSVISIIFIIAAGWPSIISAVGGYLGSIIMVTGSGALQQFGLVLLIIGLIVALWAPDSD